MTKRVDRLLRWYPVAWRQRYGLEYGQMLEDMDADGTLSLKFRLGVVWAGLVERGTTSGLLGSTAQPDDRRRTGEIVILWASAAFALAGCALAKRSEHLGGEDWLVALQVVAATTALTIAAATMVAAPDVLRWLRSDGWLQIKVHVQRAVAASIFALVAGAGLVGWANSLPRSEVEAGAGLYGVAFAFMGVLFVVSVLMWAAVATAIVRRVALTDRRSALIERLACAVALGIVAATVPALAWSVQAQQSIPLIASVLVAAGAAGSYGAARVRAA